jgi:hypothetical protein
MLWRKSDGGRAVLKRWSSKFAFIFAI